MDDHPVHIIQNHHPTNCSKIILAAKWLVRHSSTFPNQQRRPLPSLLYLSFFYAGAESRPVSNIWFPTSVLEIHLSLLLLVPVPVLYAVLRSRSWSEPRFFGRSRSRFKIWAGAGGEFFGSAPALFFGKWKTKWILIFHCILYIFLYSK